jgi:hypothetical protein
VTGLRCGIADAAVPDPGERDPNWEQHGGKDEKKLRAGRQTLEAFGERHDKNSEEIALGELPQQVGEIVGHGFAKRIIVD